MSHRSLLNGDDEPKTLPYAITLICSIGADAGHLTLLDGRVEPASQPAISTALGFDPALEPYPYDPQKARALLVDAGLESGFSFTYEFAPGTMPNDAAIMQQVAADLALVGIEMTIQPLTFVQFARNVTQGGWRGPAWAMDYAGYFYDALKPFYESLHSCSWHAPWYCDPETDRRVKIAAESENLELRTQRTRELMRHYRDIAQSLFMYPVLGLDGVSANVTGWQPWGDNLMLHRVAVDQ